MHFSNCLFMRSVNVGIFKMPNLYLRILLCFHFYHEQRSCRGLAITFAKGHSRIFGFRNIWFQEYLVSGIFGFRNIWKRTFKSSWFHFRNIWDVSWNLLVNCGIYGSSSIEQFLESKSNILMLLNKHFNCFWTVSNWF